jgi:hypothetical protein
MRHMPPPRGGADVVADSDNMTFSCFTPHGRMVYRFRHVEFHEYLAAGHRGPEYRTVRFWLVGVKSLVTETLEGGRPSPRRTLGKD